ncbi:MAG: hypothetical protein JWN77_1692 [Frankiales bacterium]|jgi:hypothetical protein|nr:hypothetical protein [Frankiales bacterium]
MAAQSGRAPRTPAYVFAGVVTAFAVLVAAVALTARQAAPPAIAEFAPQAVEQIKQTLDEQAPDVTPDSDGGTDGSRPSAPPSASPSPSAGPSAGPGASAPPAVEVPRVRQCVGSPPRQTEDPQSPPCVPYFDPKLSNGGATSYGVTKDQITVALPQQLFEDLSIPPKLVEFFNKRYEFYGRKLVLKPFQTAGCANGVPSPEKQRADAIAVQEELQAFASLAYCNANSADRAYYDALAEKKVISVPDGNLITGTEAAYARRAPYQWNVQAGVNVIMASTAQFLCSKLVGRRPAYAGGPQAQATTRKFGIIYTRATDGSVPDLDPLRTGLRSCGVTLTEVREDATADQTRNGVNAVVTMRNAGVTSLLCFCSIPDTRGKYMTAATGQGYQPEWIETSYGGNDLDNSYSGGNAPPDQSGHVLGLTFRNKLLPKQDMPWYWAVREADPTSDPQGNTYYASNSRYYQLLLLASGIQLAGPDLTPASFQRGLQAARFPNPGAAGPPYFQARVGFEGRRHVMSVDAAMFWYDPNRPGTIDPTVPGAICYVDRGRRFGLGQWTRSEPAFFSGPCL